MEQKTPPNPNNKKQLVFNLPQLIITQAPQKEVFLEGGRGMGKSTVLAWRIKELGNKLPRASMVIVGETYQQILTRTLPSTISGLAKLGYYKDIHFFVGQRPPKRWRWNEPYEPPLKYDHFLIWHTGAGFHFVSQDRAGSGRGLNTDAIVGDEMQDLDHETLFNDVLATNRGGYDRPYGGSRYHHSTMFVGTIPWTTKGKWIYAKEEEARRNPQDILYLRASAEFNRHILGDDYFTKLKRELKPMQYNAEILNIRPEQIDNGFYPLLSDHHFYKAFNYSHLDSLGFDFSKIAELKCEQDADIDVNRPFDIACDWGAHINCMVVRQEHGRESRAVNALHVKSPERLQDLAHKFCNYYESKPCKEVNFYYDHTAVGQYAATTVTYADEFMSILRGRGWTVYPFYVGKAPSHHSRYIFWGIAHAEQDNRLPAFRYNSHNAEYLIRSKQNAGVRQGRNGFEKDKRPEQDPNADQALTTHLSDADDTLCLGKYGELTRTDQDSFLDVVYG